MADSINEEDILGVDGKPFATFANWVRGWFGMNKDLIVIHAHPDTVPSELSGGEGDVGLADKFHFSIAAVDSGHNVYGYNGYTKQ